MEILMEFLRVFGYIILGTLATFGLMFLVCSKGIAKLIILVVYQYLLKNKVKLPKKIITEFEHVKNHKTCLDPVIKECLQKVNKGAK